MCPSLQAVVERKFWIRCRVCSRLNPASSIATYPLFLWHFCSVGIASSALVVAVGFCEADWLGIPLWGSGVGTGMQMRSRSTQLAAEDMLSCFGQRAWQPAQPTGAFVIGDSPLAQ